MSENLRAELPNPTLHTDLIVNGKSAPLEAAALARANVELTQAQGKVNVATQDFPEIAHDVAYAIKPEIDDVAELKEAGHGQISRAASLTPGGPAVLGVGKSKELTAAEADLERNARYATEISKTRHLGSEALQIVNSKQKVSDMNLRQ